MLAELGTHRQVIPNFVGNLWIDRLLGFQILWSYCDRFESRVTGQ